MNTTTVDGRYLAHCKSDKQVTAIEAVIKHESVAAAAEDLGIDVRSLRRTIARVKRNALAQGDQLLPIERQTNVIRDDEGRIVRWDKTKTDSDKFKLFELMESGISCGKVKKVNPPKKVKADTASLIQLADAHMGMLADGIETRGGDWDLNIATECIKGAVHELLPSGYKAKHGILCNVGDLIHFDGMFAVTMNSGNILDAAARYGAVIETATDLIVFIINLMLRKFETVYIMNIPGNHDYSSLLWLNVLLRHLYANEPRVVIPQNRGSVLTHTWGGNFLYGVHGNGITNQKIVNNINFQFKEDHGNADYTYALKGHFHHLQVETIGGVKIETCQTLNEQDSWHAASLYGSERAMTRVDLHRLGGEIGRQSSNPALIKRIATEAYQLRKAA